MSHISISNRGVTVDYAKNQAIGARKQQSVSQNCQSGSDDEDREFELAVRSFGNRRKLIALAKYFFLFSFIAVIQLFGSRVIFLSPVLLIPLTLWICTVLLNITGRNSWFWRGLFTCVFLCPLISFVLLLAFLYLQIFEINQDLMLMQVPLFGLILGALTALCVTRLDPQKRNFFLMMLVYTGAFVVSYALQFANGLWLLIVEPYFWTT